MTRSILALLYLIAIYMALFHEQIWPLVVIVLVVMLDMLFSMWSEIVTLAQKEHDLED